MGRKVKATGETPVPQGKKKRGGGGTGLRLVFQSVSSELRVSQRNLPHWQVGGAIYFLTSRLRQGSLSEKERGWVLSACLHWHQRKWRLFAAVVMPDHVHLLTQPLPCGESRWYALGEILHSVKSYSAHQINRSRRTTGPVWLDESFDRIVRNEEEFRQKLAYIANNAVKAGLVKTPRAYPYLFLAD